MIALRPLTLSALLLVLTLSGCATTGAGRDRAATQDADSTATEFEPFDPWQPFNRRMHRFNSTIDRIALRPVARGYARVTPKLVRQGVTNFFNNLQQPVTALNLVLQGHPVRATQSLGRFLINATLGVAGVFDPATEAKLPYHDQDFGQTFAKWGWRNSRYLVLPVFGPGTVRDNLGKGVATTVSPISWLAEREGAEISILYGMNTRASVLAADAFLEGAEDEYLLVRDAYLQRRRCQIVDCSGEVPDYLLPDYEFEVPDFDALRR